MSPATVSRALNNHPHVSRDVRERIAAAVRKLGYHRSALVSTVMRNFRRSDAIHRGTIAFLTPEAKALWTTELGHFLPLLFEPAKQRAEQRGYQCEVYDVSQRPERLARQLHARGVAGLLLAPAINVRHELPGFSWQGFAAVVLGSFRFNPVLHCSSTDLYRGYFSAYAELERRGYRRIGFVSEFTHAERNDNLTQAACLRAQLNSEPKRRVPPLFLSGEGTGERRLLPWLRQHRPDAVIGETPDVFDWLRRESVQVPHDVGFAVLKPVPWREELSGLTLPYAAISCAAVDLLATLIEQREWGVPVEPRLVLLRPGWHDGTTLRPLPGGAVSAAH